MNRNVIIALIVIVLVVLVGIFAFAGTSKTDSQINFLTGNNISYGGQVQFELVDAQGNALSNQNVNISFGSDGQMQTYSIVTDSQGKGGLSLNNEEYGTYNITVTYGGDDKHNGCSANQTITVGETSSESSDSSQQTSTESSAGNATTSTSTSSSQSSSSSDLNYDSDLNVHYDSNGKVVGGQNDGADYNDLKNNPPQVDEEGNLV